MAWSLSWNPREFIAELKRRKVVHVAITYAVVGWMIIQVAVEVFPYLQLPEWTVTLVIVLVALGFPVALVLAWALELTPEGVRRTRSRPDAADDIDSPPTTRSARRRISALTAIGLLVAAVAASWYLSGAGEAEVTDRTIAVLPFDATGGEESVQFSSGLYDGLLTRLTNIAALTVKSKTSSQKYGGMDHTIPEIAEQLGVAWIVEGGVHQSGDRILVNATLIDAREDDRRWARDYERELTLENVFLIQGDLARTIARSLQAELTPLEEERLADRPTDDLEAYGLYVQGQMQLERRTEAGMRLAVDHFGDAIARDSGYASAWAGLADASLLFASYGYGSPDTLYSRALEAARRALELDPNLAEARASLGQLHDNYRQDLPAALREMERAVLLKPSYAQAHQWLATLEGSLGRPEEALEHMRKAAELDPRSAVIQLVLGWTYWWVEGPGATALEHVRKAQELEPAFAAAHADEGLILSEMGRREEAIVALRRGVDLSSEGSFEWGLSLAGLATVHAQRGDTVRAREMLTRLAEHGGARFWEAMVYAALGEEDEAFRALREVEWRSVLIWDLRVLPAFDTLRDDPRYEALIRGINRRRGLNPDGTVPDG